MRKGYLLFVTTLYFVALFILFLGFSLLLVSNINYSDNQNTGDTNSNPKFVTGVPNFNIPFDDYKWCQSYFFYDGNKYMPGYNGLEKKIYCEDYNGKRFV